MKKDRPAKITYCLTMTLSASLLTLTACLSGPERLTQAVDESLLSWVEEQDTYAVSDAVSGMREANAEHKAERESSIRESERVSSVEASIEASKEAASMAKEESIASSIASSIAESQSIEESIEASSLAEESYAAVIASVEESLSSGGEPSGVLEKDKIVTVSDYAIPEIRRLFSDVVIIGNSRAKSILDSGILTESTVLYKWAAHMDQIDEIVVQGASLFRGKVLFIMGVNDLGYYTSNVKGWADKYKEQIARFRSINPDADIYLQEIIPIPEFYRFRWYNMDRVKDYNAALKVICEECDCTCVSATDFAFGAFISDDTGAHYNKQFHFYWAQTMANQMGLWEEEE